MVAMLLAYMYVQGGLARASGARASSVEAGGQRRDEAAEIAGLYDGEHARLEKRPLNLRLET